MRLFVEHLNLVWRVSYWTWRSLIFIKWSSWWSTELISSTGSEIWIVEKVSLASCKGWDVFFGSLNLVNEGPPFLWSGGRTGRNRFEIQSLWFVLAGSRETRDFLSNKIPDFVSASVTFIFLWVCLDEGFGLILAGPWGFFNNSDFELSFFRSYFTTRVHRLSKGLIFGKIIIWCRGSLSLGEISAIWSAKNNFGFILKWGFVLIADWRGFVKIVVLNDFLCRFGFVSHWKDWGFIKGLDMISIISCRAGNFWWWSDDSGAHGSFDSFLRWERGITVM